MDTNNFKKHLNRFWTAPRLPYCHSPATNLNSREKAIDASTVDPCCRATLALFAFMVYVSACCNSAGSLVWTPQWDLAIISSQDELEIFQQHCFQQFLSVGSERVPNAKHEHMDKKILSSPTAGCNLWNSARRIRCGAGFRLGFSSSLLRHFHRQDLLLYSCRLPTSIALSVNLWHAREHTSNP